MKSKSWNKYIVGLILYITSRQCFAGQITPWLLSPVEYSAAIGLMESHYSPCDLVHVLNIIDFDQVCSREEEAYARSVFQEFRKAQSAVNDQTFTARDYDAAWSSNYSLDRAEPRDTYAACAISFSEVYMGDPGSGELSTPTHLVCTNSMIAYGKHIIDQFIVEISAEIRSGITPTNQRKSK